MKRIPFLSLALALCLAPVSRAQDAATEERLNKLSGLIEDLIAGQKAQQKQLGEMARELENLREQSSKPTVSYASHEDLRSLAEAVKEIDRKRLADYEKIRGELVKLGTTLSAPPPAPKKPAVTGTEKTSNSPAAGPERGIEYVVQEGDTLSAVVQACKEKKIKVNVDQILKANPGLKPEKMRPGQKLFIPALPQS